MINALLFVLHQQDPGKGCLKKRRLYTPYMPVGRHRAFRQLFPVTFCQNFTTICGGAEIGITDVSISGVTAENVTRV